jgi:hypothetical protein
LIAVPCPLFWYQNVSCMPIWCELAPLEFNGHHDCVLEPLPKLVLIPITHMQISKQSIFTVSAGPPMLGLLCLNLSHGSSVELIFLGPRFAWSTVQTLGLAGLKPYNFDHPLKQATILLRKGHEDRLRYNLLSITIPTNCLHYIHFCL